MKGKNKTPRNKQRDKQAKEVYAFIKQYIKETGHSPSLTEIGEGCFLSRASVLRYVDLLEAWGYITRTSGMPRSISLTHKKRRL